MVDETKMNANAAAEAPAKVANTVADTAEKVVKESATVAKRERAKTARRAKRKAKPARAARKTTARKTTARKTTARKATARKTTANRAAKAQPASAARNERIAPMNFDATRWFAGFNAAPGAAPFQSMFADAGERSQDAVRRSQKVAGELAELTRGNVDALTEASRIAAEGARSLGQDMVASTREGVEQAADAVRALAEAKSPTEFVQIQNELARASFDRMVAETSRLTETMVKLAGEAFQPISNRASVSAVRLNQTVA